MGFFKGLKDDMSEAVEELTPDNNEMFDENDAFDELLGTKNDKKSKTKGSRKDKRSRKSRRGAKETGDQDTEIAPEDMTEHIDDLLDNELYGKGEQEMLLDDDMEVNTMDDMTVGDLLSQLSEKKDAGDSGEDVGLDALLDSITERIDRENAEAAGNMEQAQEQTEPPVQESDEGLKPVEDTDLEDGNMENQAAETSQEPAGRHTEKVDRAVTYITANTNLKGDIQTEDSIEIMGTIEGNVSCKGKVVVGGSVTGNVEAGELYANNARIQGDILSEGSVKIGVGSVIIGSVTGDSAVIAGAINGDIDVQGPVIVDSTAVIMGNIKSRTVQINNGAVIEGFCSQSYSDIDVKNFFA